MQSQVQTLLVTGDFQFRESLVAYLPYHAAWLRPDAAPWQYWSHGLGLVCILGVYSRYVSFGTQLLVAAHIPHHTLGTLCGLLSQWLWQAPASATPEIKAEASCSYTASFLPSMQHW